MGVGLALAVGALIAGILLATMMRPSQEGQDMSPASLESFRITTTDEGSVVPWIAGDCRVKTNLVWFGNLLSQAITQEAGGKGGGGGEVTTGYMYWMDLWKTLCLGGGIYGDVSIQALYVGDKPVELTDVDYELNDGTQSTFPTEPGQYANAMKSVAHIWLPSYYLGENVSFVPTFHFVIRCTSNAPLTYANLSNGVNPAAKIYDILRAAGSQQSEFNLSSFQTAANYWYNQGYGINLVYSSQKEARELISQVFNYVDGCLRKDQDDKWFLQAYDPADASVATFNEEDMHDFTFTRRSWNETYNDFRANYTDASLDYTRRTVRVYNGAAQRLLGYKKQRTLDLTAFRDAATASKRLSEIMRRESYPEAQISFSANLSYEEDCHVGKVITINDANLGISDADFRIISREVNNYDSNLLDFRAVQVVETLWDDTYQISGVGQWTDPDYYAIDVPDHQAIFELPYNSETKDEPAFLCLCARSNQEDKFSLLLSPTGSDYNTVATFDFFAQYGTLDETYPDSLDTDSIDDSFGILYTPSREDPVFGSISRSNLFYSRRVAILDGKEMVAFQTVTYEGSNSIRLTGVVRGLLNTPISSHAAGKSIWLCDIGLGRNVLSGSVPSSFYVKYLPRLGSRVVDAVDVTPINHTVTDKAATVPDIQATEVTRSGSTCTVVIHAFDPATGKGAGVKPALSSIDPTFYDDGTDLAVSDPFIWKTNYDSTEVLSYNAIFDISHAGAFTLYVRRSSIEDFITVTVGADDGVYTGPVIAET